MFATTVSTLPASHQRQLPGLVFGYSGKMLTLYIILQDAYNYILFCKTPEKDPVFTDPREETEKWFYNRKWLDSKQG